MASNPPRQRVGNDPEHCMAFVFANYPTLATELSVNHLTCDSKGFLSGSTADITAFKSKLNTVTNATNPNLDLQVDSQNYLTVLPMGDCG